MNGIEWNGFSRKMNGMEWNLKILFECYKIKEWKVTPFGSDIGRNEIDSFYNNITIIPIILKNIKDNQ